MGTMKRFYAILLCLPFLMANSGCETEGQKQRRHADEKLLEEYYELELIKCVNELGQERCHLIQETGLWRCRNYQRSPQETGHKVCAEDRFKDRLELLQENPEPDTTYPEKPEVPDTPPRPVRKPVWSNLSDVEFFAAKKTAAKKK